MRDQIVVQLPVDSDTTYRWIKLSPTILSPAIASGNIEDLVTDSVGFQVIVLVPGSDVGLYDINVPTQNKQRMLKAIRYANEEDLASDVEDLHFALAKNEEKDKASVAIVELALMDQWQAAFHSAGLLVDMLVPDSLVLPFVENELSILIEGNTAIVRSGPYEAFNAELDNLNFMLSLWFKNHEETLPEKVKIWGDDFSTVEVPESISVEHKSATNGLLGLLDAHPIDMDKTINFLQGDYSRREQLGKIWRPWRMAASLAGVLFVLQLGLAIVQSSSLEAQRDALKAEGIKIYKEAFPDAKRIVNVKSQMQNKLNELKGSGGSASSVTFMSLLSDTGKVFKATAGLNLKSIRYKNQMIDVELEVPNYQVLDQLKQKLAKKGERDVEIQSAVTRNNIVQGRLQIKGLSS